MSSITDVYSPRTTFRCTRLRGAKVGGSVCQFCAVGCSQLGFFKDGKLIDVEGDPRSSVNEGRLCPKGSSTYALNENPYSAGFGSLERSIPGLDARYRCETYLGN